MKSKTKTHAASVTKALALNNKYYLTINASSVKNKIIVLAISSTRIMKAKLGMPRTDEAFLRTSRNMRAAIATNASGFYSPPFAYLTQWNRQNIALNKALNDIKQGKKGGTKRKLEAYAQLKITLNLALNYVNEKAFLNQPKAILIIKEALMVVINRRPRTKKDFTVKVGNVTGEMELECLAVRVNGKLVRASYDWQYSIDGGETWIEIEGTTKAKTTAKKMKVGVGTIFRMRKRSSKTGTSTWFVSKPIMVE